MAHRVKPQTKLIVVDGNMGSGKSTTGEWVGIVMEECGFPYQFIRETERPHPVQVTEFLGRKARSASIGKHIAQSLDKWSQFVAEAEFRDSITILDGQLFHFNIDLLLFLDADKEQIIRHTQHIAEIAERLQPTLIYFRGGEREI
jgi:RNase adaptor protein for sRNA GlmZ degradation